MLTPFSVLFYFIFPALGHFIVFPFVAQKLRGEEQPRTVIEVGSLLAMASIY
jgi:hypothetical protein